MQLHLQYSTSPLCYRTITILTLGECVSVVFKMKMFWFWCKCCSCKYLISNVNIVIPIRIHTLSHLILPSWLGKTEDEGKQLKLFKTDFIAISLLLQIERDACNAICNVMPYIIHITSPGPCTLILQYCISCQMSFKVND